MKKLLLIAALIAVPVALFAQGTVNFANTSGTLMTTNSTATPPPGQAANATGSTTGAGQYTVGLYIAPAGTTDASLFTLAQLVSGSFATTPSQSGLGNGRFNGGNISLTNNNGAEIAFQVRAWQATGGATYEAATAIGIYRGVSAIGDVTPATGTQTVPNLFGTGAGQVGGFALTPNPGVPEPSSIALGLLGLGAIALFRRRKQ